MKYYREHHEYQLYLTIEDITHTKTKAKSQQTNGMRIVLIALHAGAEMKTHTADGIISIQVIDGRMKFNADNRSVELNKGQILALHKGIQHSVLAVEETLFLLTLTTTLEDK